MGTWASYSVEKFWANGVLNIRARKGVGFANNCVYIHVTWSKRRANRGAKREAYLMRPLHGAVVVELLP